MVLTPDIQENNPETCVEVEPTSEIRSESSVEVEPTSKPFKETVTSKEEVKKGLLTPKKSTLPLFVIISLIVQSITLVFTLLMTTGLIRLANRPLPSLVQTEDGILTVSPAPSTYRDPEIIKEFVASASQNLFTWSSIMKVTSEDGKSKNTVDQGVMVGAKLRVPTPTFETSFVLSEDFRTDFLQKLAQLIPSSVWDGNAQVFVKFVHIGEPEPIGEGEWKVTQVANLIVQDRAHPAGRAIPLNKIFYVKAVDTPPLPPEELTTPLQKLVYQIRLTKLEITKIKDFELN